jgi:cytolysin (calcineurin-like family phosphatase)
MGAFGHTKNRPLCVAFLFCCWAGALKANDGVALTHRPNRDVTFIVTSDCHYDAFENEDRNDRNRATIREMNAITNMSWPEKLGGSPIQRPRGVLVLGDVIDDGDRIFQDKHQTPRQWLLFQADFGLDGRDGLLDYPVYETWGNHDGPPVGKDKHGFSFQKQLKNRNRLRQEKGWLTGLSRNELHYSWDWDDVHFVQLGIYPADRQHPDIRYNPVWHDPQNALAFLKEDLAKSVGRSGRPVVLMSHCGIDADWWHKEDMKVFYESVKDYNVILYLYGHSGTGYRQWAPPGESNPLNCVNTGQTENGFFVIRITSDKIRLAYRVKHWIHKETPDGKPGRTWDGKWEWKHIVEKSLAANHRPKPAGE